jgi:pseudouridine-5'-phosphate glycosidase
MSVGQIPLYFEILPEIQDALSCGQSIVALESAVITHGLPYPENLKLSGEMEIEIRNQDSIPATIALLDGKVHIGLTDEQLMQLALGQAMHKISARDFGTAICQKWSGGTTVAGTLLAAKKVGIRVFATGGIGGVHRQPSMDISADLPQLANTPMIVVCSGAKSILNLEATIEYLETYSVPVIGYQTNEFPAFFSITSGLKTSGRVETPEQAAKFALTHWMMDLTSAVLLTVPPPASMALAPEQVEEAIHIALHEADEKRLRGQAVTPFLLRRVAEITGGQSLKANLQLLKNNAQIAGKVAQFFKK